MPTGSTFGGECSTRANWLHYRDAVSFCGRLLRRFGRSADRAGSMISHPTTPPARQQVTHRAILPIALPIMLSNVSTPLLGIVDTGVVGQLPDPAYIGGVALGALVFNFVFWAFGFLRMGTTGLTAQAVGAGDATEVRAGLGRAVMIAVVVGAALVAPVPPAILRQIRSLREASEDAEALRKNLPPPKRKRFDDVNDEEL